MSSQLAGGTIADIFRGIEVMASQTALGRFLQGISREEAQAYRQYAANMAERRPVMRLQSDESLTLMPFQDVADIHKLTAQSIASNGSELIGDIDFNKLATPLLGKKVDTPSRRIDIPLTEEEKAEDEEFRQSLNRAFTPSVGA